MLNTAVNTSRCMIYGQGISVCYETRRPLDIKSNNYVLLRTLAHIRQNLRCVAHLSSYSLPAKIKIFSDMYKIIIDR